MHEGHGDGQGPGFRGVRHESELFGIDIELIYAIKLATQTGRCSQGFKDDSTASMRPLQLLLREERY